MTEPKRSTRNRRRANETDTESGPALEVVSSETETTESEVTTEKRTKIHRDLTSTGVGMIGEFEEADPDAVPASGKAAEVEYLFAPLEKSYNDDKWMSQVVTDAAAAERAVRLAASKMGYGVKIRTEAVSVETETGEQDAVRVYFKAGEKVKRTRKESAASQGE